MKKVLLTIISVCLIAASIFGLFAGVSSFSDIMNVKEYKEKDAEEGLESIDTLDAGLDQLQENEGTYLAGVDTYTAGLISYSEGKTQLSAGYAAYYAGKKQLEEGKAAYAAGKKQIEDNTQAYNEGKATLAKIEPLMPYVNQYVEFRDGTIANLAGFSSAQAWFVSVVRPIAAKQGLNIPADVTDLPAYVQQMVADGKAQLKQYEDGLVQLAEAEKAIAAGEAQLRDAEKQLAQGENDLAAGGNQLADGKKQLNTFEDGCAQVAAGCELLLTQPAYMNNEGKGDKVMCPSVADILKERCGDNFSIWELDDNGEVRVVNCRDLLLVTQRDGHAHVHNVPVYVDADSPALVHAHLPDSAGRDPHQLVLRVIVSYSLRERRTSTFCLVVVHERLLINSVLYSSNRRPLLYLDSSHRWARRKAGRRASCLHPSLHGATPMPSLARHPRPTSRQHASQDEAGPSRTGNE